MEEKKVTKPKEKKRHKVAIVGFAPTNQLAPFDDKSFEIWGVNELYKFVPRLDVLFEMHTYNLLTSKERNPKHLEWLQKAKIPIYMLEHYDDIPQSIPYPKDEIIKRFGSYFTTSISYMIALAIFVGATDIHLYGIDMATNKEYQLERPSVEYYIGIARGLGINVYVPPQSDLLKTMFLYGYESDRQSETILKMRQRTKELQANINRHQTEAERAIGAMNQMIGALDDLNYWQRCWVFDDPGEKDYEKVLEKVNEALRKAKEKGNVSTQAHNSSS